MRADLARPLAASLMLGGFIVLAGVGLASMIADRAAALAERDAKIDLLANLQLRRPGARKAAAPPASLAIVAATGTLAAAQADALVRSAVATAGGTVLSSRADVRQEEPGLGERIEVQASIEGRIEALQATLFALESGAPLVLVDAIALRPAEEAGGAETARDAPTLQATLTLSTYRQARGR